jgi:hypothetical protein
VLILRFFFDRLPLDWQKVCLSEGKKMEALLFLTCFFFALFIGGAVSDYFAKRGE